MNILYLEDVPIHFKKVKENLEKHGIFVFHDKLKKTRFFKYYSQKSTEKSTDELQ